MSAVTVSDREAVVAIETIIECHKSGSIPDAADAIRAVAHILTLNQAGVGDRAD